MEIKRTSQFQQGSNLNRPGKTDTKKAFFQNITDSFKPGDKEAEPVPDLKTAANILLKKDEPTEIMELWENKEAGLVFHADDYRVIMGSYNDKVKAVDPGNGKVLWKTEHKGFVRKAKNGTLYVSGTDSNIYALDPKSGKDLWSIDLKGNARIFELGDDGTIYARAGKKLFAVDPKSHKVKNEFEFIGDPVMGKNGMVFGGGPDQYKVRGYDLKTGEKKWEISTEGMVRCAPAVGKDGTVYVGQVVSNKVVALEPDTGKKKWEFQAGDGIVASPAVGEDGTVYVGDKWPSGTLYALVPGNGKPKWTFKRKGESFTNTVSFGPDGTVFATSGCNLFALNPNNGKIKWEKKAKSYLYRGPEVGTDGRLYIGTNGQGMHCLKDPSMIMPDTSEEISGNMTAVEKDLTIEKGEGFVDIGGVKLKVSGHSGE